MTNIYAESRTVSWFFWRAEYSRPADVNESVNVSASYKWLGLHWKKPNSVHTIFNSQPYKTLILLRTTVYILKFKSIHLILKAFFCLNNCLFLSCLTLLAQRVGSASWEKEKIGIYRCCAIYAICCLCFIVIPLDAKCWNSRKEASKTAKR